MRKPFTSWHVGDTEYKLKLTTATVCKLEENLGVNIIKVSINLWILGEKYLTK